MARPKSANPSTKKIPMDFMGEGHIPKGQECSSNPCAVCSTKVVYVRSKECVRCSYNKTGDKVSKSKWDTDYSTKIPSRARVADVMQNANFDY